MALHTELPIYKLAYDLLGLAAGRPARGLGDLSGAVPQHTPKRSWRILAILALVPCLTHAADETWTVATITSHHFDATRHYNEQNYGLGFERATSYARLAVIAGEYRNSFDRTSVYAAVAWTPLALGPAHFGLIGGALTGYASHPVLPMILPTVQLELGAIGANLYFAPKIKDGAAVLGLQVKMRF